MLHIEGGVEFLLQMQRLTKSLSLTLAVFLFSATASWSADFEKGVTANERGDYATAFRIWKPLAEKGNAKAQLNLGVMHYFGLGVPKDYKTAVKWIELAAEQGHANAQFNLGLMYYNGEGVIQDDVYAHMWTNLAAANEDEEGAEMRDLIAIDMSPSQLKKAQALAREYVHKNYKGC